MLKARKKRYLIIFAAVLVAAVAAIVVALTTCGVKLNFSATFYYVCYDSPSDAHSASSMSSVVHSYGGAGYLIEDGGKYYVTVSCYYDGRDAQTVCQTLNKKGLSCSVLKVSADSFKLSSASKKYKEKYTANLNTLLTLSKMSYGLANSLDSGSYNQEGAKAVLSDVKTSLGGLLSNNAGNCFEEEIAALIAECDDVSHGYILAYDVRRLQIAICDCLVNIKLV